MCWRVCLLSTCSGSTWLVTVTAVTASPSELARVQWPSMMFAQENARYSENATCLATGRKRKSFWLTQTSSFCLAVSFIHSSIHQPLVWSLTVLIHPLLHYFVHPLVFFFLFLHLIKLSPLHCAQWFLLCFKFLCLWKRGITSKDRRVEGKTRGNKRTGEQKEGSRRGVLPPLVFSS